jgi:hypothetical protein
MPHPAKWSSPTRPSSCARPSTRCTLQTKLGKQERAKDTRRKVLLGAFILYRLEKGQDAFSKEQLPDWLRRELPGFITREDDAALFVDLLGEPAAKTRPSEKSSGAASAHPPA